MAHRPRSATPCSSPAAPADPRTPIGVTTGTRRTGTPPVTCAGGLKGGTDVAVLKDVVMAAVGDRMPVDERERMCIEQFLVEIERLTDPFSEHADPVHVTTSALIVGRRGVVLHRHRILGIWVAPGGHIDLGENPWDAVMREAAEETGLTVGHVDGATEPRARRRAPRSAWPHAPRSALPPPRRGHRPMPSGRREPGGRVVLVGGGTRHHGALHGRHPDVPLRTVVTEPLSV